MNQKLTPFTVFLLILLTLLWASNAVVGKLVVALVPPITLNFFRWLLAFVLLLFIGGRVLAPRSELWSHWRYYAALGLTGIGLYNALQYLAFQTSCPINVTLVGASMPIWRSEEHTSELQSRGQLVCRLLLEKKTARK